MRPLRALLLVVGLLPAVALVGVAAYGFLAPNTWEVRVEAVTDVAPDAVIAQVDDSRRWDDWMFVGDAGASDFVSIEYEGAHTGIGAGAGWRRSFEMGRARMVEEWEDADGYSMMWLSERAGRPREAEPNPLKPQRTNDPTAWVETTGHITVSPEGSGSALVLVHSGTGGPRPLGPFLLGALASARRDKAESQLEALVSTAEARSMRGLP